MVPGPQQVLNKYCSFYSMNTDLCNIKKKKEERKKEEKK